MRIILSFNEAYAPHAAAVITGLIKHSSQLLSVAILYLDISDKTIARFKSYYSDRLDSIEFYKVEIESKLQRRIKDIRTVSHLKGNVETYLRLFAHRYIKDDYALYLDCDIVVNGDVCQILNEVDYNCYVSGVKEYDPNHKLLDFSVSKNKEEFPALWHYICRDAHFYRLYKYYEMENTCCYMNAGVTFMNLKKWRDEKFYNIILSQLLSKDYFFAADQDVLNSCIKGEFGKLSPRWNSVVLNDGILSNYNHSELKEAIEKPIIVHLAGEGKPWNRKMGGTYRELYWEYRLDTPWPEYNVKLPKEKKKSLKHKLKSLIKSIIRKNGIEKTMIKNEMTSSFIEVL